MKKLLVIFTLILSFAFSTTSFAATNNTKHYFLNPGSGNEKTFEGVSLTVDGDTYTVNVKDKKAGLAKQGYHTRLSM